MKRGPLARAKWRLQTAGDVRLARASRKADADFDEFVLGTGAGRVHLEVMNGHDLFLGVGGIRGVVLNVRFGTDGTVELKLIEGTLDARTGIIHGRGELPP